MSAGLKNIEIALRLKVGEYTAGLGVAAAQTKAFGKELTDFSAGGARDLDKLGKTSLILGGTMLAGFGLITKATMGFESELSEVGAVSDATGEQLSKLSEAALQAGADTVFSASEAAQAETELAKAGVSTSDILGGGLVGSLNLASAGHLELGRAAELSANAMNMFHLKGSDVPHIADVLAASANKSAAEVEDMGQALQQSGLVAGQLGLTLEDTSGVLAMFAQAGLKGSDGGTSLKTALQRLVPQSAEAASMMKALGLDFFDANGQFIGISKSAQMLHDKLGPLQQETRATAMQTIFGADAIRSAAILYEQGGTGVDSWVAKVNDAGYAEDLAAKKLDNLAGDVEAFKGSLETTFIKGGAGATSALRGMTQAATTLVNGLGDMPPGMMQVTTGFLGIAGAVLTAGGAVATVVPKYQTMMTTLADMGSGGVAAGKGISFATNALMVAGPGLVAGALLWGSIQEASEEAYKTFTKGWKAPASYAEQADQFNKLNVEMENLKKIGAEGDGVGGFFKEFGQNLPGFSHEIANAQGSATKLAKVLDDMKTPTNNWREANVLLQHSLGLSQTEVDDLASKLGVDLTGALTDTVPAFTVAFHTMGFGTPASQELGLSLDGLGDKTMSVKDKFGAFKDLLDELFSQKFDAGNAADAYQGKLNHLGEVLTAAKGDLTGGSDESIALRAHLQGMAKDVQTELAAFVKKGATPEAIKAKKEELSRSFMDISKQYYITEEQARGYISILDEIPDTAFTQVAVTGAAQASTEIADIQRQLDLVRQGAVIPVSVQVATAQAAGAQTRNSMVDVGAHADLSKPWHNWAQDIVDSFGGVLPNADGNIITYGNGGEHHVAQIARAGDMRVWAEPETGGESYIPHAPSKRARSTRILAATAHRFGYQLADGSGGGPQINDHSKKVTQHQTFNIGSTDDRTVSDIIYAQRKAAMGATHL